MNLSATDIAAWWGAITGTILCIIEIVRFRHEKPNFDVTFYYEYDEEYLMRKKPSFVKYIIRNCSDKTTTIKGITLYAWMKVPRKIRPTKYWFHNSGVLDWQKHIDFPQKLEAGSFIEGRIEAKGIVENARKSCRPIVMSVNDARNRKPREFVMKVPKEFTDELPPLDQLYNQIRLVGDETKIEAFVSDIANAFDIKRTKRTRDPSRRVHLSFPHPQKVAEPVIRGFAQANGVEIIDIILNVNVSQLPAGDSGREDVANGDAASGAAKPQR